METRGLKLTKAMTFDLLPFVYVPLFSLTKHGQCMTSVYVGAGMLIAILMVVLSTSLYRKMISSRQWLYHVSFFVSNVILCCLTLPTATGKICLYVGAVVLWGKLFCLSQGIPRMNFGDINWHKTYIIYMVVEYSCFFLYFIAD